MSTRGFTLIETVVYIGLLGVIMAGCLGAVWEVVEGMGQVAERSTVQDEGSFVVRKMQWALGSATSTTVGGSGCSSTLGVIRNDGTTVNFRLSPSSTTLQISEDAGATWYALTSPSVSVTCVQFQTASNNGQIRTAATTTLEAVNSTKLFSFSVSKYIRR